MTDQDQNQNQDGQKTIVAFIVGLLIGGLIVWMFAGEPNDVVEDVTPDEVETATSTTDESDESDQSNDEDGTDEPTDTESANEDTETNTETPTMERGDGEVNVTDQPAGSSVTLESVTYPMSDGWIGVREYSNDRLGRLLGVARFSESEGLIPEEIILQGPTEAGRTYAIVFYSASATNEFSLATNTQVDGVFATFTAQ